MTHTKANHFLLMFPLSLLSLTPHPFLVFSPRPFCSLRLATHPVASIILAVEEPVEDEHANDCAQMGHEGDSPGHVVLWPVLLFPELCAEYLAEDVTNEEDACGCSFL